MADTLNYFQQALWLAVIMAAPPLLIATLFGVMVSLVQAVTQIQDQTLPFVVKLITVAITLAVLGRWFGSQMVQLTSLAITMVPNIGR